ncbi:MAG TPA: hypothetical protein VH518_15195 [Tepidisphaeraceae bacterium]|jgi:hypothetical protein
MRLPALRSPTFFGQGVETPAGGLDDGEAANFSAVRGNIGDADYVINSL